MAIIFDGPNKLITLNNVTLDTVANLYSRWKDWVKLTDNAKFLPAFSEVGGENLGGGLQSGINIFLRNDLGWRIKPPEQNILITLAGNLYPNDPDIASFLPTTGAYDSLIRLNLSANLLQVDSGGGGLTAAQVWAHDVSTATAEGSAGLKLKDALSKMFFKS